MTKRKESAADLEHQAPEGVDPVAIAAEWADDYPKGAELFCGTFEASDFEDEYGYKGFPNGTTIAVRRGLRFPTPGWLRRHKHLSSRYQIFALLELHASHRALEILDNLKAEQWEEFIDAWGNDGEILPKSSGSVRPSVSTKPPAEKTS